MIGRFSALLAGGLAAAVSAGGAAAAPVQWGGNGHWYEFIDGRFDWFSARDAAAAMTHMGMPGYLATITSAAEQAFLDGLDPGTPNGAWLGGSDADVEGVWRWVTGPEAGQLFTYTEWSPGEPNNSGNEDYLHGWFNPNWNDVPASYITGYVVEFSDTARVPLPAALPLMAGALGGLALFRRRRAR